MLNDNRADVDPVAQTARSGFRRLDDEHNLQLDLLAAFRRALAGQQPAEELDEILERLVDFTKLHYASEQTLMRLYGYPHLQEHVTHHDRSLERLLHLQRAWRDGDPRITDRFAQELSQQVQGHMSTADRALAQYLTRLGVGPG